MAKPTLLPSGLMDVLPPQAAAEFRLSQHFLNTFAGFGYQPVIPPLAEYESSLLAEQGGATGHHVFRVADPLNSHMLALRADMTGQLVRIATTALKDAPRPLRLCYAGQTLRTTAEPLKTRRQHTQVGIERFGDAKPGSIAEVLAVACHALKQASMDGITIDLHYPSVMTALLEEHPKAAHGKLRETVRLKDTAALRASGAPRIADLVDIAGNAQDTLPRLAALNAPALEKPLAELKQLCDALKAHKVDAAVTIDLLELSGYGYYHGIGYALYWNAPSIELGRGGCYRTSTKEEAVGFTLYINELLAHLPPSSPREIKRIAPGTTAEEAAKLQAQGYITVYE